MLVTFFRLSEQERKEHYLAKSTSDIFKRKKLAIGTAHMAVLEDDGTVSAYGDNSRGQCEVAAWRDIQKIAAGDFHTVGLKKDGTVLAAGDNTYGQCNVGEWSGVAELFAERNLTTAFTQDGGMLVAAAKPEAVQAEKENEEAARKEREFAAKKEQEKLLAGVNARTAAQICERIEALLKQQQSVSEINTTRLEQMLKSSLEKLVREVAAAPVAAAPQQPQPSSPPAQPKHMQPPSNFGYKIVNGQAYILSYTGDERDMVIPETIEGAPVTMIEVRAFENDTFIERVVLPPSLQIIRKYAFRGCENLRKIEIPGNSELKIIGECAFEKCEKLVGTADSPSQKRLVLPNGIQSIARWAFAQCQSLHTVVVPESIQTIGFGAFSECTSLDKLWLPQGAQNRLGRLDLIVDRLNCLQWGTPAV